MTAQARKLRGATGGDDPGDDRQASEQPVSWLELFFDLIFVTAFDRLSQRVLVHPDLPTFGLFLLLFVALWWAWLGNTNVAARSGNSGRAYRWGTLVQMLFLSALAVSVRGDLRDVGAFFALFYAAGQAVLVVMLVLTGRSGGERSRGDALLVRGFTVGVLLWTASAALHGPAQLLLWGLALVIDILCVLSAERQHDRELPHQGHFPERVGLLFIVFLGAVVTELIRGAAEQRLRLADQLPALLALLTVMALWRMYFDESHTLPALLARRSGHSGTLLAWSYTHLPLTLGLSLLGVGLGLGIAEEGRQADEHERVLVSAALALVFLSLTLLRFLSVRALRTQADPGQLPATATGRSGGKRLLGLSLSSVSRLGGAILLLLLILLPIGTTLYQAACAAITLVVGYLSWRDPLRSELNDLEDRLSDEGGLDDPPGSGDGQDA